MAQEDQKMDLKREFFLPFFDFVILWLAPESNSKIQTPSLYMATRIRHLYGKFGVDTTDPVQLIACGVG